MDAWTVVFVPAEGDPGNLLAEGPGGSRAPMLYANKHHDHPRWHGDEVSARLDAKGWSPDPSAVYRGLLLRDRDMTVMPGYDRLTWALWVSGKLNRSGAEVLRRWIPFDDGDVEGLEQAIRWATTAGLGKAVCLDKQGRVL